jgi:hypothetical protein
VVVIAKPHENPDILNLMDSSRPNFDGGSKSMWGSCDVKFNANYYVIHS